MFDWMRGDKYRIRSKEWFEKECIKEDGFYIHHEHQQQYLPQEAVDKYAGKVLEIQSSLGQYGAFVMSFRGLFRLMLKAARAFGNSKHILIFLQQKPGRL